MSNQDLQPGEIEEETHIITERIIEQPQDEEQEASLFEEYIVKGAAFTLGAAMFLLVAFGVIGLILEGGVISTIFGILLGLLTVGGILEYMEE